MRFWLVLLLLSVKFNPYNLSFFKLGDDTSRSSKNLDSNKSYGLTNSNSSSNQLPSSRQTSVFGKGTSRYIPDLNTTTSKAREQELNDEGFEETQSLVSETLSQEASSGNYETDTHDSTRCSPAELTRTTSSGLPKTSSTIIGSNNTATSKSLPRRESSRVNAQDKNLARIKSFDRRDSRDSLSSRTGKPQESSSFLPKRTSSLKREPPTRLVRSVLWLSMKYTKKGLRISSFKWNVQRCFQKKSGKCETGRIKRRAAQWGRAFRLAQQSAQFSKLTEQCYVGEHGA